MKIGIVGDFSPKYPSQIATNNALKHTLGKLGISIEFEWIATATINKQLDAIKHTYNGFWIGPGYPDSLDGVLSIIQFARENDIPLLGTCGGFQYIIMEYAKNKLMLEHAAHEERDPHASQIIISKLACSLVGQKGEVFLRKHSKIFDIYKTEYINEQFRCNYGLSSQYEKQIHDSGLRIVGTDSAGNPRVIEIPELKFFIGTLFVPQLSSTVDSTHCIIDSFITTVKGRLI
ncbi:glutamine amidotransferase-related protein [Paenibacillus anseongense]|uniref:CTP synthase C-terminal region-related (seleno)protein n=1 Tax=Paenibacillus anseongense TaxID=2682845 RepID=UPI002DB9B836|nr:hypothetical protein [Paenibacillus anseongense]MEC0269538.1 hypothetical protein [Paenibacillus anseongense]